MTALTNPVPMFYNGRGIPLTGGYVYIGEADKDPQANPINVFLDGALDIPLQQPLRTIGGLVVSGVNPTSVFFAETDFSIRVTDSNDVLIFYSPSLYNSTAIYQPRSDDLSAIAQQGTTQYGRSLLSLANQAALVSAIGGKAYLASTGGTVSGNIVRQDAGVHAYWADAAMTGGRIYVTPAGDGDPTSAPGDLWLTY